MAMEQATGLGLDEAGNLASPVVQPFEGMVVLLRGTERKAGPILRLLLEILPVNFPVIPAW